MKHFYYLYIFYRHNKNRYLKLFVRKKIIYTMRFEINKDNKDNEI